MKTNNCIIGDCRDSMRRLLRDGGTGAVQTIVTSPPYWGLRDYGVAGQIGLEQTMHEYIANMVEVFGLCRELLADDGTLWLNLGDTYANNRGYQVASTLMNGDATNKAQACGGRGMKAEDIGLKPKDLCGIPWRIAFALQDAGWFLRQDIIWHKPNPMPESVRDRCTKAHEYMFLLSKSEKYYFDQEAIKEDCKNPEGDLRRLAQQKADNKSAPTSKKNGIRPRAPGNINPPKGQKAYEGGDKRQRTKAGLLDYAKRAKSAPDIQKINKRSVWTIATEPYAGAHFATFPTALVEPCILAGSRPGDIVFDPFLGSGTTAQVAQQLGRKWIGCEMNANYLVLQNDRTRQQGLILQPYATESETHITPENVA